MATYAELKKQIADLEKEAEKARQGEIKEAVATVKELIARYALSAEDLGLRARGTKRNSARTPSERTAPGTPKYRDPVSGKTWTGKGKPPNWIARAKNRDDFLITAGTASATGPLQEAQAPAKTPTAKRGAAGRKGKVVSKSTRVRSQAATRGSRGTSGKKKKSPSEAA